MAETNALTGASLLRRGEHANANDKVSYYVGKAKWYLALYR